MRTTSEIMENIYRMMDSYAKTHPWASQEPAKKYIRVVEPEKKSPNTFEKMTKGQRMYQAWCWKTGTLFGRNAGRKRGAVNGRTWAQAAKRWRVSKDELLEYNKKREELELTRNAKDS